MLNIELLRNVVDAVEKGSKDGTWDQSTWVQDNECGTSFCVAGWTMMLSGQGRYVRDLAGSLVFENILTIERDASNLLGITEDEGEKIFYNMTTNPNDVRVWAKELAAEYGEDL